MQIVRTTNTCNIYGVNPTADNRIIWKQKTGTPYILMLILNGGIPTEEEFFEILRREEMKVKPDIELNIDEGYLILRKTNPGNLSMHINQTNVTVGAFAADLQNGKLIVYGYGVNDHLLDSNFCMIRTNINIECQRQTRKVRSGGLFGIIAATKKDIPYYKVTVSTRGIYKDGDAFYQMGNYTYPIPASVVEKETSFYLPEVIDKPLKFGTRAGSLNSLTVSPGFRL